MRRLVTVLTSCSMAFALASTIAIASASAALAPARQQSLRVAIGRPTEGRTLDPARANVSDTSNIIGAFLAPLYRATSSTTLEPVLAASTPVIQAGGKRIVVHLRPTLKWSDGHPLTATDVVTAYRRTTRSYYRSFTSSIANVTATNAHTVTLILKTADPIAVQMLASTLFIPVPTSAINKYGANWTKPGKMLASGPFVETASSTRVLDGTRNRFYYHAAGVKLQKIEFVTGTSAASTYQQFTSETVDTTLNGSLSRADFAKLDPAQYHATSVTAGDNQYLFMNTTNPALSNVLVRQAIAQAIDRTAIAPTLVVPTNTFIPTSTARFNKIATGDRLLSTSGSPDVAAAKARLAQAGLNPNTTLNLYYPSDAVSTAATAASIQANLAAVGVNVALHPDTIRALSTVGTGISPINSNVDLNLQGWVTDYADPWNFYQLLTCSSIKAGLNTANYCDHEYDTIGASIAHEYDYTKRVAAFSQLEQHLTGPDGTFPFVPLGSSIQRVASHSYVNGFGIDTYGITDWGRVSITKH